MKPEEIKEIRLMRNLSQAQAAKLVGVSTNTWYCWERGRPLGHPPRPRMLRLLEAVREGALTPDIKHAPYTAHVHNCAECQTLGFRLTRAKLETEWQG